MPTELITGPQLLFEKLLTKVEHFLALLLDIPEGKTAPAENLIQFSRVPINNHRIEDPANPHCHFLDGVPTKRPPAREHFKLVPVQILILKPQLIMGGGWIFNGVLF